MLKRITDETLKSHNFLSKENREFIEYVRKNPYCLDKINFIDVKEGHCFSDLNLNPWPTFVSREVDDYFNSTTIKVYNLIKSVPLRVFNNDLRKISEFYQIPVEQLEIIFWGLPNNQIDNLIGRGDFILDSNNVLKCIEFNIAAGLGGWQIDFLSKQYQNSNIINDFLINKEIKLKDVSFFFNYFDHIRILVSGLDIEFNEKILNIVCINSDFSADIIAANRQVGVVKEYFEQYKKYYEIQGSILFCKYDELDSTKDGLFYMGIHIHCVIEWDIFTPFRFIQLVKNKKVLTLNGTITYLMTNKLNIVALSENQDSNIFNENEQELIKKHIPWSRKLVDVDTRYNSRLVSLVDLVINNKDQFVLKRAYGSQGQDVFIGKKVHQKIWKEMVIQALEEKSWIIQEFIKPQEYWYQTGDDNVDLHEAIFGLFALGNRYAGGFIRLLSIENENGIINSKQGASESTMLIVK